MPRPYNEKPAGGLDGGQHAEGGTGEVIFETRLHGDAFNRFEQTTEGEHRWGLGGSAVDFIFKKVGSAARTLSVLGNMRFFSQNTGDTPVQVKGATSQASDLVLLQDSTATSIFGITAAGVIKNYASANEATTVGAAGAASALPANPVKYLTVKLSDGNPYKIPVYNP